jgi:hypothetical protein
MVRCQASLSYEDMNMARDGFVMTRVQIREERVRLGYCVDCLREPILLYKIRRNRLNPLWTSREPLTVQGDSLDGKCLRCHPELDPNRQRRRPRSAAGSLTSSRTNGSRRSATGDDLLSQSQHPTQANLRRSTRSNSPLDMTLSSSSPLQGQVRTMSNPMTTSDRRRGTLVTSITNLPIQSIAYYATALSTWDIVTTAPTLRRRHGPSRVHGK